ncbi:MICOS complex subunit Mic19-like [Mizuhopecten yessoensis]|uniref:Coiled-coil-helix-coiled-coil-helix domain-containing protein 3, mitochondrial n=1 Tax=Mizuhopecten yessoensis TaxID=6573 RepID=A0A210Q4B6_MIZYE|nr:MICOS complex subunit Mic19-like [Mizuhopecten yessoensis]OWF43584.1 Coiled-coil-helix-coiled-coil-helix domain-containing protein 3, mitochondrial [Mizuhopecten yessoensis]
MGASDSKRTMVVDRDDIMVTQGVLKRLTSKEKASEPETKPEDGSGMELDYAIPSRRIRQIESAYEEKLKMMEEKEAQAKSRLQKYEEQSEQQLQTQKEEFSQAMDEVENKFMRNTGSPVCQDIQQDVFHCYQNNPEQTLNCSSQVRAFTSCVDDARKDAYDMSKKA